MELALHAVLKGMNGNEYVLAAFLDTEEELNNEKPVL